MVVVGAGPSGSTAARYAAVRGARVLLHEEHAEVGEPVQCAGLFSENALKACDIEQSERCIVHPIRGAFIYSPGGRELCIDSHRDIAYVVERCLLDRLMADRALDSGAEIILKSHVTGVGEYDGGARVVKFNNGGEIQYVRSKVVIGADGAQSTVGRLAGLDAPGRMLSGVQFEVAYDVRDENFVEVFLGSEFAPGFFAWSVPLTDSIARVGICCYSTTQGEAVKNLRNLIETHPVVSGRCRDSVLGLNMGGVPLEPPGKTVGDGIMIVGDAAGHVKPTSGGGVYMGATCAKIAGEVAADAVGKGDSSAKALAGYEQGWRNAVGRELSIGLKLHDIFRNLSDRELDKAIEALGDESLMRLIVEYGDMDHPSILIRKLLMHRSSPAVFKSLVKAWLRDKGYRTTS